MTDLGVILAIPSIGICPFTLKGTAYTPVSLLEQLQTVIDDTTLFVISLPKIVDVSPIASDPQSLEVQSFTSHWWRCKLYLPRPYVGCNNFKRDDF